MNDIELNAILYYADFLSLKATCQPVTDNCKYFFIHGTPVNSLYILDEEPIYDEENAYFQQAKDEYEKIKNKFGEDGVESFIDDICVIRACGSVDAERMLKCIHQYSTKKERKQALNLYYNWRKSQTYSHITINDDGDPLEQECSPYVYHAERLFERSSMEKDIRPHSARYEVQTRKPLL